MVNELAKTEKKNITLANELAQSKKLNNILQTQCHEFEQSLKHIETSYQALKEERTVLLGKMEQDKDRLIESLREELKQSHQASLAEIKNVSFNSHDLLMQEKVVSINLKEQVKGLTEELNKQQQTLIQANNMIGPLIKEINWFRKFITEILTFEQLQEYEKKKHALDFMSN